MNEVSFESLAWYRYSRNLIKKCKQYDTCWRKRNRSIDTLYIVNFIFRCVSEKSTTGYASKLENIWINYMKNGNKKHSKKPYAASSVCEARQKVSPELFKEINQGVLEDFERGVDAKDYHWHGHRLFAVDGSWLSLPPSLKKEKYTTNQTSPYYPRAILIGLYQLKTGMAHDLLLSKERSEHAGAKIILNKIKKNDVALYDRGFYSYELLSEHCSREIHAVFRLKESIKAQQETKSNDEVVQIKGKKDSKELKLRIIKYKLAGNQYILGTTLLDKKYTIEDLKALYHARWGVEEFFKTIKSEMGIESFHSKSEQGIKQELYAAMVVNNMTRLLVLNGEKTKKIGSKKNQTTMGLDSPQKRGKQTSNMLYQYLVNLQNEFSR